MRGLKVFNGMEECLSTNRLKNDVLKECESKNNNILRSKQCDISHRNVDLIAISLNCRGGWLV